ncbi:MAG: hypothetical protein VX000_12645, partial [Myxococcota bacterium]|nr:hypothetical protein [Myxococcota bacterium]
MPGCVARRAEGGSLPVGHHAVRAGYNRRVVGRGSPAAGRAVGARISPSPGVAVPPRRFGRYELLEHLATGGMAEVWLARSFGVAGFEKRVVIKRILPGLARSPRFVRLFVQEARITAG